jgi:FkbM family methyltransferase
MGTKLACPSWSKIAGAWVSIGAHEPELFFVADSVREGDVFVDVGANIGVYAVTAALRGARAIAYEPNEQAMAAMRHNAELNGVLQRLTCSTDALSDFDGEASFTTDLECSNQLAGDGVRGMPVRVRKLDSSLSELRTQAVDFLKIDAEGFDEPVLRGALETLRRNRPTVIVEIWGGGVAVRRLLESAGYRAYGYDYEGRVLRELAPEFAGEGNLVAVHESRIAQTRGRLAEAAAWLRRGPRLTFRASSSG